MTCRVRVYCQRYGFPAGDLFENAAFSGSEAEEALGRASGIVFRLEVLPTAKRLIYVDQQTGDMVIAPQVGGIV